MADTTSNKNRKHTHTMNIRYVDADNLRVVVTDVGEDMEVADKTFTYPEQHDDMSTFVHANLKRYPCDNEQRYVDLFELDMGVTKNEAS